MTSEPLSGAKPSPDSSPSQGYGRKKIPLRDDEIGVASEWVADRDGKSALRFKGVIESAVVGGHREPEDSNKPERWSVITLWRTCDGTLIAGSQKRSTYPGERTFHSAKVCADDDEIRQFFGFSAEAKELYRNVDIDYSEWVD